MQSPINRPEDAPSAVGCASSLGRESGVGVGGAAAVRRGGSGGS